MIKETLNNINTFNSALDIRSVGVSFMHLSLIGMFSMFIKLFKPISARAL